MNQPKPYPKGNWWQAAISVIFAVSSLFASSHPTRAILPDEAKINEIFGNTSELRVRRNQKRDPTSVGTFLQYFNDALITVPPNNTYALLLFFKNDNYLETYVKTNQDPRSLIYYFPCTIQGVNVEIGWGLDNEGSRGCEAGMTVKSGYADSANLEPWLFAERLDPALLKQIWAPLAQAPARQIFYCSAVGDAANMGFATATSGDPCTEALQQCQAGGAGCEAVTAGFWWTNEEQLTATLNCGEDRVLSAEGTAETIESAVRTQLQSTPDRSCSVQVYRPQDFLIIPASDREVRARGDDGILVKTVATEEGIGVEVIEGAINVRSTASSEPILIPKGQQYIHSRVNSANAGSGGENPGSTYEGKVEPFDRQAAITSLDMEVLCAFASNPENYIQVSACNEANLMPIPDTSDPSVTVHTIVTYCDNEQVSGGTQGDKRTLQTRKTSGELKLEYEMYIVPDRVQIIYEGREILDTGFISGRDRLIVPYEGQSGRLEVILTGNESTGTRWDYKLICP